ncbi:hypothetical protein [Syntrophomonas erecta]
MENNENNNGLDLFLNISLKYPDLNAVRYRAGVDHIMLELAIQGHLEYVIAKRFRETIDHSLKLFHNVKHSNSSRFIKLELIRCEDITLVRFYRDVDTLSDEEIQVFMGITRQFFKDKLVAEDRNSITEDSLAKKIKHNLLQTIKKEEEGKARYFYAYRKNGRVFVFQR